MSTNKFGIKKYVFFITALFAVILFVSAYSEGNNRSVGKLLFQILADSTKTDTTANRKYKPSRRPTYKPKDRYGDEVTEGKKQSKLSRQDPKSVKKEVSIDESGQYYNVDEKLGNTDYRPGTSVTFEQYKQVQKKQAISNFYKQKAKEKEEKAPNSKRGLVPRIYMNPNLDRIFGGNYIDVKLNGSVLLDFGYRIQITDNPNIPVNQRSIGGFFFDQQIAVNAQAKIGERLKITINQDTKSQFDFDNNVKVEYTSLETDIIQKIEAGNVNFPINSSLITGAQNLFGVKAVLRFGRLTATAVVANQRGRQDEIKIQSGGQTRTFEVRADQYEDNRHYFLSQFFRDNYEKALATMPMINSGVLVTNVEVWVTNRNNTTATLRNVCALMDLGEAKPYNTKNVFPDRIYPNNIAANDVNNLGKILLDNKDELRKADNTAIELSSAYQLENGNDFEMMRNARLLAPTEYKVHPQLGYISLNAPLGRDDVLGVSFEYTFRGPVSHRVGEIQVQANANTNTNINANSGLNQIPGVTDPNLGQTSLVRDDQKVIFVKLLRPSTIRTTIPMWDLQMKNIYPLNASGIQKENFQLRVTYRDDQTQLNNPVLKYGGRPESAGGIEGKPLLQVTKLDQLNMSNDPQPDGNFDFVDNTVAVSSAPPSSSFSQTAGANQTPGQSGTTDPSNVNNNNNINNNTSAIRNPIVAVTIDPVYGRVIFPVLEPFGKTMEAAFGQDLYDHPEVSQKYVYDELYRKTKGDAIQLANKNKYFLVGRYQSASSDEIQLQGLNIPPASIKVFSGSIELRQGTDYQVFPELGKLKILNPAYLQSGQDLRVTYEKTDLFQIRQRAFYGTRLDYVINKDFALGGTFLALNERPLVKRVAIGDEPVNNYIGGLDATFKRESNFITRVVDKLPFYSTKEKSSITAAAEVATLVPSVPDQVNFNNGTFYIDDFENTQVPYTLDGSPTVAWHIGSTPRGFEGAGYNERSLKPDDQWPLHYRRAKMSWYMIDNVFFAQNQTNRPGDITSDDMLNHYVRPINPLALFPDRDRQQIQFNQPTMDVAFYPNERGMYNLNPNLNADGTLKEPKKSFGAITRAVNNFDTDFDNANYQYFEFWLMDPFAKGDKGKVLDGKYNKNNTTGGKLQFHFGSISEDFMKDGRMGFENGLPTTLTRPEPTVDPTIWGWVTNQPFLTNAFNPGADARKAQDIGHDGMNDDLERDRYKNYVEKALVFVSDTAARNQIINDPAGDNFRHYLDGANGGKKVLERYKNFNGVENNSPLSGGSFNASSYITPDNEDINQNNTLNDVEEYFNYELDLNTYTLDPKINNYIINTRVEQVLDANGNAIPGNDVTWYQFRIPLREGYTKVGNIQNFKSIRFMRMLLTGWEEPVVLRFVQFQLVASQWRPFLSDLSSKELKAPLEPNDQVFSVSTVSVEENSSGAPGASTPYRVPPGDEFKRDYDLNSQNLRRQNERSLRLCVDNLSDDDARAVFKNYPTLNLINFKRIKMLIHAESPDPSVKDGDLEVFMRIGTDFTDNFYEVAIPLTKTDLSLVDPLPQQVWPLQNHFDFSMEDLAMRKLERNQIQGLSHYQVFYAGIIPRSTGDQAENNQHVYIRGDPTYSNIQTIMIGIRNRKSPDRAPKSMCIWVNEMRTTDIQNDPGYAATARVNIKLADLGNVSTNVKYTSAGWGGLEQKVSQRTTDNTLQYGANTNIAVDKLIPKNEKIGIRLPMYASYDKTNISPKYDPLIPDVTLNKSVATKPRDQQAEYRNLVEDNTTKRSLNFTNIQKVKTKKDAKSYIFDIENFNASVSYSDIVKTNVNIQGYEQKNYRGGVGWAYAPKVPNLEPLKGAKGIFSSPYLKLVKDINLGLFPNNLAVRGDLDRTITRTQYSNGIREIDGRMQHDVFGILPTYEKRFMFNRNYVLSWNITKSISFNYNALANAIIDEPRGEVNSMIAERRSITGFAPTETKISREDSIWLNLKKGGRMKTFNQSVRVNYRAPLDKLPLTNWMSADASYAGSYSWSAGAVGISDSLGNTAQNTRDITLNGRLDFNKLYNKWKFLAKVNSNAPPPPPPPPPDPKDTTKKKIKAPLEFRGLYPPLRFLMMLKSINVTYQLTEGTVLPGYLGKPKYFGLDQQANGQLYTDFLPFVVGDQNQSNFKNYDFSRHYMSTAAGLSSPITQNRNETYSYRLNLEPFKEFKIQLDGRLSNTTTYAELYRFNKDAYFRDIGRSDSLFQSQSVTRFGTYNVSFLSYETFFEPTNSDFSSSAYNQYINNQTIIAQRLNETNPFLEANNLKYDTKNQDVKVISFIAAYSGKDPMQQTLSSFPRIPLPGWRVDYGGIPSLIPSIKRILPSISITHAYNSSYSANYRSSPQYQDPTILSADKFNTGYFPYLQNESTTGAVMPIDVITSATIIDKFAPLLGINIRTKSNMSFRIDYSTDRNVTWQAANTQITEIRNNSFNVSYGYTKANLRLPFLFRGREIILKNDVQFRVDFSRRESINIQRVENLPAKPTTGSVQWQLRPNISYQVNQRLNTMLYFEWTYFVPLVPTSFTRTTYAFGIQIRYSLS
ncbi:MAG: cell surface protein SprA [Bacteroidota bacterium]|nr:cell surface protein SprA [Bacteroidota bacterium]